MSDERALCVGIDLCEDYTQISCFNRQTSQPDSVADGTDRSNFRVPTALVTRRDTGEWMVGNEALAFARDNEGDEGVRRVDGILAAAAAQSLIKVFDTAYSPSAILEKFFRRLLLSVKQKCQGEEILSLVVTLTERNERTEAAVKKAFADLGIGDDRLKIISHLESFMYYTVSQTQDIWINDVALFDYDERGLNYYRLAFGRKSSPIVITAMREDLSENLDMAALSELPPGQLAYSFGAISGQILHKQIISALFVTGMGFEGDWANEPLKSLCAGRRVFRGQNLYTKGACYAAKIFSEHGDERFVLISDDMLRNDIGIRAFHDGEYSEVPLAHAGQRWADVKSEVCVIMDGTDEIDLLVKNIFKKEPVCAIISLGSIGDVSGRNRRMRVNLDFLDRDSAVVTIRDDGFGEMRASTHRIWEQILKL